MYTRAPVSSANVIRWWTPSASTRGGRLSWWASGPVRPAASNCRWSWETSVSFSQCAVTITPSSRASARVCQSSVSSTPKAPL